MAKPIMIEGYSFVWKDFTVNNIPGFALFPVNNIPTSTPIVMVELQRKTGTDGFIAVWSATTHPSIYKFIHEKDYFYRKEYVGTVSEASENIVATLKDAFIKARETRLQREQITFEAQKEIEELVN